MQQALQLNLNGKNGVVQQTPTASRFNNQIGKDVSSPTGAL